MKNLQKLTIPKLNFSKEDLDEWIKGQLGENNERFEVVYPKSELTFR